MTKTGYTFGGWYKDSALGAAWDFYTDTVTATITLYAKWNINQYTATFNADGGAPAPAQQTVNHGGKVNAPADMTKTGYTFGGWYKESAFTTAWNFTSDTVTGTITLYAKWDAEEVPVQPGDVTITITLDSSGIEEPVVEYDEGAGISGIIISRSGTNHPQTYTITLASPNEYTDIEWEVPGVGAFSGQSVTKTDGDTSFFALDAANTAYNSIGMHVLYLELTWKGKPYLIEIPFKVVN
jgi:uncharacterized repeat protein (TIGR02543 family)